MENCYLLLFIILNLSSILVQQFRKGSHSITPQACSLQCFTLQSRFISFLKALKRRTHFQSSNILSKENTIANEFYRFKCIIYLHVSEKVCKNIHFFEKHVLSIKQSLCKTSGNILILDIAFIGTVENVFA